MYFAYLDMFITKVYVPQVYTLFLSTEPIGGSDELYNANGCLQEKEY